MPDRELMFGEAVRMLGKATTRLEILLGRMRACPSNDGPAEAHSLSLSEGEAWIAEQRDLLRRLQGAEP